MITNLRLKNFKAWGEQLWKDGVELAPVTLFLGTNSAGKTSLLQPLLLLQQTFACPDRSLDLYLGGKKGDVLDLGTFDQIIHGHKVKNELGFGLRLADVRRMYYVEAAIEPPLFLPGMNVVNVRNDLDYEVTFGYATGGSHLRSMRLDHAALSVGVFRSEKGAYRLAAPGYQPPLSSDGQPVPRREYKPEKSVVLSDAARHAIAHYGLGTDDLSYALRQAIENIRYLGPLRERPQTTYLWGGQEPGQLGSRGEDAIPALLANLNAVKKAERGAIVSEVSRWLKEMGVADGLKIEQIGSSRFYEVKLVNGSSEANLVHVGFGVSQVLPMIVLALTAPEGSTIIAEQPEIHLHPLAQSVLANLLVETAKRRHLQFLIETHSEHLFRRLQFLVASEQVAPADCRLYFVDRERGGQPTLSHLRMDEFGRIANWPAHFFGDAMGDAERQVRAMIARRRATPPPAEE